MVSKLLEVINTIVVGVSVGGYVWTRNTMRVESCHKGINRTDRFWTWASCTFSSHPCGTTASCAKLWILETVNKNDINVLQVKGPDWPLRSLKEVIMALIWDWSTVKLVFSELNTYLRVSILKQLTQNNNYCLLLCSRVTTTRCKQVQQWLFTHSLDMMEGQLLVVRNFFIVEKGNQWEMIEILHIWHTFNMHGSIDHERDGLFSRDMSVVRGGWEGCFESREVCFRDK